MPGEDTSIVEYDSERALAAARSLVGEEAVLVCAEYTPEDFRLLYVDDRIESEYGTDADVIEAGELFHRYGQVDFFEGDTVSGLYEPTNETQAFVTYTDFAILVRVLGGQEGLYCSVEASTEITPLVERASDIVADGA